MIDLSKEIAYFESREPDFVREHKGDWVVISDQQVQGFYKSSDAAFRKLNALYDPSNKNKAILVREVGAPSVVMQRMTFATI